MFILMKIKMYPDVTQGSIASVMEDHRRLLAQHSFVQIEEEADLVLVHASAKSKQPDITFTHGLYPTADSRWSRGFEQVNQMIFDNIANSLQAVAVSQWGGQLIKRYCGIQPTIIHNGIFYQEYKKAGKRNGPVLWGKTSINPVCDPTDFNLLSRQSKGDFVSFVDLPHTRKIPVLQRADLQKYLQSCSMLIATTKENDSLLIMEAMACGVPVLAYNWGQARERLIHKQGCYLVPPHNTNELLKGYAYLREHWDLQSQMAHTVAGWFDWELQKPKLLRLLDLTLQQKNEPTRVSIIIPCHNYGRYVKQAIQSAKQQTVDCEVIVVDDGSTDDSLQIIQEQQPSKIIVNSVKQGVAQSRNAAIEQASGTLIVCLDADDTLHPDFIATLLKGFTERSTAVCFTPIRLMNEAGQPLPQLMFSNPPNILRHQQGLNQVPSCCMFRKSWWERAGGYDHFLSFTEDANLWLKIFLLGGKPKKVGGTPLMNYRRHANNNSLKSADKWNIFHSQKVLANESLHLLLLGEGLDVEHAYWRLKELPYAITICTDTISLPTNYLVLTPAPDIQNQVQEKLQVWTQLFSYQPA